MEFTQNEHQQKLLPYHVHVVQDNRDDVFYVELHYEDGEYSIDTYHKEYHAQNGKNRRLDIIPRICDRNI